MATNLKNRKPRQSARQAPSPSSGSAGSAGDGRPLSTKDNQAAIREAEQAQLLSFMAKIRAKDTEVQAAAATLKERKDELSEVVRLAGIAGFKKYELMDLLKDSKAQRRDLTESEQRRHRFRQYLGLPTGKTDEQLELEERMPDAAKDEAFWRGDGYAAGLRGDACKAPADAGVHGQAWMEEWGRGQTVLAERLAPKAPAAAPAEEKEPTRAELKAQERRAKESLEHIGQAKTEGVEDGGDPNEAEALAPDGFEASEEELQGQIARRVIQEERQGEEAPEAV